VRIDGLRFRDATVDFAARGQGLWPRVLLVNGEPLAGTTKLPPLAPGRHAVEVEYGPAVPEHPLLTLAVDAQVRNPQVAGHTLRVTLEGEGYTPLSFFSPGTPRATLGGREIPCEWDARTGRGRARGDLSGQTELMIESR
jgi:hypothetical protein